MKYPIIEVVKLFKRRKAHVVINCGQKLSNSQTLCGQSLPIWGSVVTTYDYCRQDCQAICKKCMSIMQNLEKVYGLLKIRGW